MKVNKVENKEESFDFLEILSNTDNDSFIKGVDKIVEYLDRSGNLSSKERKLLKESLDLMSISLTRFDRFYLSREVEGSLLRKSYCAFRDNSHKRVFMKSLSISAGLIGTASIIASSGLLGDVTSAILLISSASAGAVTFLSERINNMDLYKENKLFDVENQVSSWLDLGDKPPVSRASIKRLDAYNRKSAFYLKNLSEEEINAGEVKRGIFSWIYKVLDKVKKAIPNRFDGLSQGVDEYFLDIHREIKKVIGPKVDRKDFNGENGKVLESFVSAYDHFNSCHLSDNLEYLANKKASAIKNKDDKEIEKVDKELDKFRKSMMDKKILNTDRISYYAGVIKTAANIRESVSVDDIISFRDKINEVNDDEFRKNFITGKVVSYKLSIKLNLGDSNEDIITRSKILNLIVNSDSADELVLKVKNSDLIFDDQQIKDMESITKNIYEELNSRLDLRKESFRGINEKTKEEQIKDIDAYIGRVLENHKKANFRINKKN